MDAGYYTDPEYFERLDGVDYPKVSPRRTHSKVQKAFMRILDAAPSDESGAEWKFRIGRAEGTDSAFLPDVAYVEKERIRALSPREREEPPFAPDIAIEIRSPGGRRGLREEKIRRYLRTGAKLVLDVDPARREIHAYEGSTCRTFSSGERFECASFPWLAYEVADVFAELNG